MVINTMGWVEGLGYDLLLHSIQTLKVGCLRLAAIGSGGDAAMRAKCGIVTHRDVCPECAG